ncbi:helix-turn-helix domain-containing protein [Erythrobacter sp. F6033]|uniref:AraC family transcriptional regulator n=1 Tax=Erythrobacter sp. F6033 TaxID=2926401 RepID=UPI001FF53C36|nr:helix-turn-helix domain-containing protein [Erythrobacter sp. F6033]MCK0129470.1 helix-turn-helix domain-containing protein [Erythrobacter sp. F6033]
MLVIATALTRALANHTANRSLAILLVVLVGTLTPWAIGFAGFYDRWQWLSFAPFSHPLAVAPLFYFYLFALVHGRLPGRLSLHLAAPIIFGAVMVISFLLPADAKSTWARISSGGFDIVVSLGIVVGFAMYGRLSWLLLRRYRVWLASERSDDDRFAARWLQNILIGGAALLAVWAVYEVTNAVIGLSYRGLMGLYIVIAILGTALAIEGWRHAHLPFPSMPFGLDAGLQEDKQAEPRPTLVKDANRWVEQIRQDRLYEDPEISLARAARHLGTNQSYLSRAVNEQFGMNWSALINGMRSEAVAERLAVDASADILRTALECGFNSKASFNRSFRAHHGMTPSAFRRETSQNA